MSHCWTTLCQIVTSLRTIHRFHLDRSEKPDTDDIVRVKCLRLDGKGVDKESGLAQQQLRLQVPTGPDALDEFIKSLPSFSEPILYSPQCPVSEVQQRQLETILPAWALPLSSVDGLKGLFNGEAQGM